jgi:thiosulfate/3-mercaptopyruvate sulfurtransferase
VIERPLVDGARVRERLGDSALSVVDCRWRLGEPGGGEREYLAGHVPGAAFLDVDAHLSSPPGAGGRHPLPAPDDFQAAARRAGISASSDVVAYGEGAPRLWWLLRHFGHESVAVLEEWDGPLRAGAEEIPPGDFRARPRDDDTVTAAQILHGDFVLLDARAPERYRGEVEPIDPVAGHIPGARNVPFEELAPGGRLLPAEELRARLGDEEFVAYCGSGVTACTLLLAAEVAGAGAGRLYPGSWSEWCALQ